MKVTLRTGDEIEIIGPVVKPTREGVFISHREFNAKIKGVSVTISTEELEGATFPKDVEQQAQKAFEATLPDVAEAWNRLKRLYAARGEKA